MELSKKQIYAAVEDWYAARIDSTAAVRVGHIAQEGRLDYYSDALHSAEAKENIRKLQLLWRYVVCAPELWTHNGKLPIEMLAGWDEDFCRDLFGTADVMSSTARNGLRDYLERTHIGVYLFPLVKYLEWCAISRVTIASTCIPAAHQAPAPALYNSIKTRVDAAAFGKIVVDRRCEPALFAQHIESSPRAEYYQAACRGLHQRLKDAERHSYRRSAMYLANSTHSCGVVAATVLWMLYDKRNSAKDVHEMTARFVTMPLVEIAPWCEPLDLSNVEVPHRHKKASYPQTKVERDLSDPDNWDEGDPMRDPVVKWLAETLRPDSINWTLGDHVHCVLISAMQRKGESAASSSAIRAARELYEIRTRYSNKRSTAALIDYVEPIRTGFVQGGFIPAKQDEETTMQRGFRDALHRLVDASAEPDPKVFAYVLLTEFGERLRLSNKVPHFKGAVERDTLAHVDSSGRRSVLWASTGGFIYRAVPSHGRELIDWQHPDNVAHLQACYNAHNTPLGDTHPCSHFTSRPH